MKTSKSIELTLEEIVDKLKNTIKIIRDFIKNKDKITNPLELVILTKQLFSTSIEVYFSCYTAIHKQAHTKAYLHFLPYDRLLEALANEILKIDENLRNVFHNDLSNQFMRNILLFYNAKHCMNQTFMSLLRYGRDGVIIAMDKDGNALDINNHIISDNILQDCLENLDKKPEKRDNTLPVPNLLCTNLESKSKLLDSYFTLKSVLDNNAIMDLNKYITKEEEDPQNDTTTKKTYYYNYDKNKYDGFMLGLLYKKDFT